MSDLLDLLSRADSGDAAACYDIFKIYKAAPSGSEKAEAVRYLERAADTIENASAEPDPELRMKVFLELGDYYHSVDHTERSMDYYGRAAELGNGHACLALAEICLDSESPDTQQALCYLNHAEFEGEPEKQYRRGVLYLQCGEYIKANLIFQKLKNNPGLSRATALLCRYRCAGEEAKAGLLPELWEEAENPEVAALLLDVYTSAGQERAAELSPEKIVRLFRWEQEAGRKGIWTDQVARLFDDQALDAELRDSLKRELSTANWERFVGVWDERREDINFLQNYDWNHPWNKWVRFIDNATEETADSWERYLKNFSSIWDAWERTPRVYEDLQILDFYYPDSVDEVPGYELPSPSQALELGKFKQKQADSDGFDWICWAAQQGDREAIKLADKLKASQKRAAKECEKADGQQEKKQNSGCFSIVVIALVIVGLFGLFSSIYSRTTGNGIASLFQKNEYSAKSTGKYATITEYTGNDGTLTIPSKVKGKTAIMLDMEEDLDTITISAGIENVGIYSGISIGTLVIEGDSTDVSIFFHSPNAQIGSLVIEDGVNNVSLFVESSISIGEMTFADSVEPVCIDNDSPITFSEAYTLEIPGDLEIASTSSFKNLETLVVGNDLTTGYRSLLLSTSLTSISVGRNAEFGEQTCAEGVVPLREIYVGGNMITSDSAFKGYTELETIEVGHNINLEAGSFENCASLHSVSVGGYSTVGNAAFRSCTSLSEVAFSGGIATRSNAFAGCTALTTLYIGGDADIGENAFSDCTGLETIEISGNTTTEFGSFSGCTSLVSVKLDKVVTIGGYAFSECSSLTDVYLGEGDEAGSIEWYAFEGTAISEISIPGNILSISRGLLNNDANAYKITWAAAPNGETQHIEMQELFGHNSGAELHLSGNEMTFASALTFHHAMPTIYAPAGSSAQEIAEYYNCTFIVEGE